MLSVAMLSVVMLSVVMLSVVTLSVVMLNEIILSVVAPTGLLCHFILECTNKIDNKPNSCLPASGPVKRFYSCN
jgi:hypothetical protein